MINKFKNWRDAKYLKLAEYFIVLLHAKRGFNYVIPIKQLMHTLEYNEYIKEELKEQTPTGEELYRIKRTPSNEGENNIN